MRTALSIPLVGAALLTAGAVVLRLLGNRAPAPAGAASDASPARGPASSLPLPARKPLPERLRERGF